MLKSIKSLKAGFTLLELLAVMSIMLILSTIAVTSYRHMITGTGIGAAMSHLHQTLALARQNAIMQGKRSYVVFFQDDDESWYVTCMAEGTKTHRSGWKDFLVDCYNLDLDNLEVGTVLHNLSADSEFATVVAKGKFNDLPGAAVAELRTEPAIWTDDARYGWEVTQRVRLPRGFRFSLTPPPTICFLPSGMAVNTEGRVVTMGQRVGIFEEIRSNEVYTITVEYSGAIR